MLEMRIVVNQAAHTIDEVVRKLQRSHVQFLDLLMHEFERVGVPANALYPLKTVRTSALNREPSWFNQAKNYKAATEAALIAKVDVFRTLTHSAHWAVHDVSDAPGPAPDSSSDQPAPSIQAEQMFLSAELCAAEGEVYTALSLLHLSLSCGAQHPATPGHLLHPRLRPDDEVMVNQVYAARSPSRPPLALSSSQRRHTQPP